MVSECGFTNETIMNKLLSSFAKLSIMYICSPNIENFRNHIVFKELNICNYIELC